MSILHLRAETKPLEHRSCLTPTTTKALLDAGYTVHVERSKLRIFNDQEFADVGAKLVDEGSWPNVDSKTLIVGLKELPEEDFPLKHTHIQFAHCFKRQTDWDRTLSRFPLGGGLLYDLEFLTDSSGRRVAAFGYHAGYAGSAISLLTYTHQFLRPETKMPGLSAYPDQDALITDVKRQLAFAIDQGANMPQCIVIGALGRCGSGAVQMLRDAGVPEEKILKWDMAETKRGGPFEEIPQSEIFVNCIYLTSKIAPFVTKESIVAAGADRRLRVVCDVSCDPNSENNPIPIYTDYTYFSSPAAKVDLQTEDKTPLDVVAIDHLPSLLPREASEAFSSALLPSLVQLNERHTAPVWTTAEKLFWEKVHTVPTESGWIAKKGLQKEWAEALKNAPSQ